ncbi:DNA-binding protein [Jiella endophytica]|uniref:DNA-binding protein n=1 Tax=Jiella endophytica TaxID=2558362 RepID=A0A4Y8RT99_9HYPH|nr:DNA-binding protein [Jiella endophytica]TFF27525.1 DNA-binding protein [Jiella endophytica]
MTDRGDLTPRAFDRLTRTTETDFVWTASGIARFLGCGPDLVRSMREAGAPIRQVRKGGQIYASRAELLDWLKSNERRAG